MSGGTAVVSAGGTAIVTTSIGSGGVLQTANGGTAIVSGTVFNSGTLIASGSGSLVEISSGAIVSGGAVVVGNGIVDVLSGGSANVAFRSTGSGGLEIADTHVNSNAFTGAVSRIRRLQSYEPCAVHRSRLGDLRRPHDQLQLHLGRRRAAR